MKQQEANEILIDQTKLTADALINAASKSEMFGASQLEFLEICKDKLLKSYKKELGKVKKG